MVKLLCAVFLVPGAFGQGTSSWFVKAEDYFAEYAAFFAAKGCAVGKAVFPADATIEVRGLMLRDQFGRFARAQAADARLAIVAHSQGALDARFALKQLGLGRVSAVVAIGAPHAGSPLAEWVVRERERRGASYWLLRLAGYDLSGLGFAGELTPGFLKANASRFEAVGGVRYGSARGVCRTHCAWALRMLNRWTDAQAGEGEGDGLVPRASQQWGEDLGEYDLDHISEVGTEPAKKGERQKLLNRIWAYLGWE